MKLFLFRSLCLAGLCAATARANDILIYKISAQSQFTAHTLDYPDTFGEDGMPAFSGKITTARYAVIDLTAPGEEGGRPGKIQYFDLEVESQGYPAVDAGGNPVFSKKRFFTSGGPEALSESFDPPQPLKAKGTHLWNNQIGGAYGGPGTGSLYESGAHSAQLTGVATPLVVSKTLTIPNVPRTIAGSEVLFGHTSIPVSGEDPIPYLLVYSGVETSKWTLDTALTKSANTAPVSGTADLDGLTPAPDYRGTLAAATLQNGVQRVRNLLYGTGYRLGELSEF